MQLSEYRVHVAAVIEGPGKNNTMKEENCPRRVLRMCRIRELEKARF